MTHKGNNQVKEAKALALIHKYQAFKMEDDEGIEVIFSRFQTLVVRLKVLDKGYTTTDHVKKIIRSLPKKWRLMVIALKLSNFKNISNSYENNSNSPFSTFNWYNSFGSVINF